MWWAGPMGRRTDAAESVIEPRTTRLRRCPRRRARPGRGRPGKSTLGASGGGGPHGAPKDALTRGDRYVGDGGRGRGAVFAAPSGHERGCVRSPLAGSSAPSSSTTQGFPRRSGTSHLSCLRSRLRRNGRMSGACGGVAHRLAGRPIGHPSESFGQRRMDRRRRDAWSGCGLRPG